jgi:hypothetical protein
VLALFWLLTLLSLLLLLSLLVDCFLLLRMLLLRRGLLACFLWLLLMSLLFARDAALDHSSGVPACAAVIPLANGMACFQTSNTALKPAAAREYHTHSCA